MNPRPVAPAARRLAPLFLALALAGCASTHGLDPQVRPTDADTLAASATLSSAGRASALSRDDPGEDGEARSAASCGEGVTKRLLVSSVQPVPGRHDLSHTRV